MSDATAPRVPDAVDGRSGAEVPERLLAFLPRLGLVLPPSLREWYDEGQSRVGTGAKECDAVAGR
jgi:hypothetical protein